MALHGDGPGWQHERSRQERELSTASTRTFDLGERGMA